MAHSRSLGFARDDKKERVVSKERVVAEPRHLSKPIWTCLKFSRPFGTEFAHTLFGLIALGLKPTCLIPS